MNTLPKDIYAEIAKHVAPSDQLRLRRVNRRFAALPFDLEYCCVEPTNLEIAKWFLDQSYLMSRNKSIFNKRVSFSFSRPDQRSEKLIAINVPSGKVTGSTDDTIFSPQELRTIDEILDFLGDDTLILRAKFANVLHNNWLMVRDILSRRSSCQKYNVSSDKCFLQLLIKYINIEDDDNGSWLSRVKTLGEQLNSETRRQLEQDITNTFTKPIIFSIANLMELERVYEEYAFAKMRGLKIDFRQFTLWLKQWFSRLTSANLFQNPSINYANTHYT